MTKVTPKQYARLLYELTQDQPVATQSKLVARFVQLVAAKHQLSLAERVISEYDRLYQEETGEWSARVATPQPLSSSEKKQLLHLLASIGFERAILSEELEPELIGGIKISVKDLSIDGTFRRKLELLRQRMINAGHANFQH